MICVVFIEVFSLLTTPWGKSNKSERLGSQFNRKLHLLPYGQPLTQKNTKGYFATWVGNDIQRYRENTVISLRIGMKLYVNL